ncbi:uncharacterized protein LOC101850688 [Aplysia californica]|uniref:Uncharacterized protein LOC101850688 n=1 Tax=Aplysia californica TaxID=6500 RepID=A0ABM0K976_APLCA|nr:uncharacterized protein LOC101850688 [Aplysia californica]
MNHPSVSGICEGAGARIRRALSLQEQTERLGLGGVMPPECKRSFLVTKCPGCVSEPEFWRLIFDTGCRTVVRLVPTPDAVDLTGDRWPVVTPDFSVNIGSKTKLKMPITETMFTLSSDSSILPCVDTTMQTEQTVKLISVCWTEEQKSTSLTFDLVLLVFKLLGRWLTQTRTSVIAVQCSDQGWLDALEFCVAFNAMSDMKLDGNADIFLCTQVVQCAMEKNLTEAQYKNIHTLCRQYLELKTRRQLERNASNLSSISLTSNHSAVSMASDDFSAVSEAGDHHLDSIPDDVDEHPLTSPEAVSDSHYPDDNGAEIILSSGDGNANNRIDPNLDFYPIDLDLNDYDLGVDQEPLEGQGGVLDLAASAEICCHGDLQSASAESTSD